MAELGQALPPTEFTPGLMDALASDYCAGQGVADAFGRWLERMLGPHGLVVYDASDPAAKPLAAPLFRAEIEHAGRTSRLAAEAGAALVGLGYHSQVAACAKAVWRCSTSTAAAAASASRRTKDEGRGDSRSATTS